MSTMKIKIIALVSLLYLTQIHAFSMFERNYLSTHGDVRSCRCGDDHVLVPKETYKTLMEDPSGPEDVADDNTEPAAERVEEELGEIENSTSLDDDDESLYNFYNDKIDGAVEDINSRLVVSCILEHTIVSDPLLLADLSQPNS